MKIQVFSPFCRAKYSQFEIFDFLNESKESESIFVNLIWSIFEKFYFWKFLQVFWPILYGKKLILRFSIFWMNQKMLSNFWKILFLKLFLVFWPILYEKKLILRFSIFWMNQKILSIFQKIMLLWWKKVIKFNQFFPSQ